MIFHIWHHSPIRATLLTLGFVAGAISPYLSPSPAPLFAAATNTSFPDTQAYWGQPFIQALAERNIVTGYPDNTYRPEQPVKRDEFAAILQAAFAQPSERQIASGSVYKDIPEGYWASSAIEEAYEMGFMKGYLGGEFRPNQPVTKVEVLTSLAQNLALPPTIAATSRSGAATTPAIAASQQPRNRRRAKQTLMFPLAITALMPPLMTTPTRATVPVNPPASNLQAASSLSRKN
ncbi:S-layer homology domain-containing protein [Leptolyngbyaceae cyanobacterium UHCC 1019]